MRTRKVILELHDLAKDYGDGRGLLPANLRVGRGELVMLVGANGAGKSTLLGTCAGLLEPTGGRVTVLGAAVGSVPARRSTSYIPDTPALYDDLSVWEHLEYITALYDRDEAGDWQRRADGLLKLFELDGRADELVTGFSRGLKQKAALVIGLVRPFDLLLVDEPYLGLDAPAQAAVTDQLGDIADAGQAVLVATHQPTLAARATRCIGLRDGEVVYDGEPDVNDIWTLVSG